MIEKTASVHWDGPGKNGKGQINTETGALERYPYGFATGKVDTQARVRLSPQGEGFVTDRGKPEPLAEEIAARVVNKERAQHGESVQASPSGAEGAVQDEQGHQDSWEIRPRGAEGRRHRC